jgi:hypothetical protein
LRLIDSSAATPHDEDIDSALFKAVLDSLTYRIEIHSIDRFDIVDSKSLNKSLEVNSFGLFALGSIGTAGIRLMTGHGSNGVIKDDSQTLSLVINRIEKPCNARMEES